MHGMRDMVHDLVWIEFLNVNKILKHQSLFNEVLNPCLDVACRHQIDLTILA